MLSHLVSLLVAVQPIQAIESAAQRESLAKLSTVAVVVKLQGRAVGYGLEEESVRATVELRLRQAGFKPIPEEAARQRGTQAVLEVTASISPLDSASALVSTRLELFQWATLVQSSKDVLVKTWSMDRVGVARTSILADAREKLGEVSDILANEWLSVNSPKP